MHYSYILLESKSNLIILHIKLLLCQKNLKLLLKVIYHIRTNIGKELNVVNWRIAAQSPNLNLINIFSIAYQL